MGGVMSALKRMSAMFSSRKASILMLGLDAAGKTTVLYFLRLNEHVASVPTVGFNVETVRYKNVEFHVWDVGGQDKLRGLWRHYYDKVDALIFVVDANDRERIAEARTELHKLLREPQLAHCTVLVIANKQDLPHALKPAALVPQLQLDTVFKERKWYCHGTVATTGDGLYEALDWLASNLPPPTAE
eukprot:TRINITY_DN24146_c0_g1_i1.p1 TRINITY_DN24146_c0_g1~~TRINITY_DN24146_c0_g1_i1.p1  ORF type:complete len:187 (-),score=38.10 TRINITY_DN24146_c0_g1_i1:625-1185(-)